MSSNKKTLEQRFWEAVDKTGECWVWTKGTNAGGYGRIGNGKGKLLLSNRVSWMIHFGDIPTGMLVCHRCDNPGCVRPEHLFLGTAADNVRDMITKNRLARGEKRAASKLTDNQVRAIKKIHSEGRLNQVEIARIAGTTSDNINRIVNGKRWTHIDDDGVVA